MAKSKYFQEFQAKVKRIPKKTSKESPLSFRFVLKTLFVHINCLGVRIIKNLNTLPAFVFSCFIRLISFQIQLVLNLAILVAI